MVDNACLAVIERFVVLLYDRTSNLTKVNEVRQDLFSKKSRTLEKIPFTQEALLQHTKRSVYQGGHIWAQTLVTQPVLPSPSEWGWQRDDKSWTPMWTTLPQMKDTCYELIHCSCSVSRQAWLAQACVTVAVTVTNTVSITFRCHSRKTCIH